MPLSLKDKQSTPIIVSLSEKQQQQVKNIKYKQQKS
ncbi:unnamed protein product [Paramecium sonneborni]|uniref:Uncharacterized protein n=1 Tax=Paramecium sonneborni TaxID=65129 RepID=A0A8S1LGT9_9CILI|nr:unnamed protein product [Paramecium sonneborni]